jgi:putative transcriptional regulator|tara:strand:+ start:514 stop:1098 length:585 start_codon:yes stop_codon:yes gene_type:complete
MIDTQGKLLVAPPNMPDWRFRKSVVYMWRHDVSGAAGVIINKKCEKPTFEHVCQEGAISRNQQVNPTIYYGGPVLTNIIGVLHSTEYKIKSTNMTAEGKVGFTLDRKILEDIAMSGGPLNKIVTLGMANWDAGQLEEEIEHPRNPAMSWLLMDYDEKLVFGQDPALKPDEIWEDFVSRSVRNKTLEITSKIFKN